MNEQDILYAWLVPFYYRARMAQGGRWGTLGPRRQWELVRGLTNDLTGAIHNGVLQAMGEADEAGAAQEALEMLERVWRLPPLGFEGR
jgi:hypothetical protein